MPELPEVEITKMKLAPLIRGRRILGFSTDWPRGLRSMSSEQRTVSKIAVRRVAEDMCGRKILGVARRGKVLFFRLSRKPERIMAIHLRMSGRLEIVGPSLRRLNKYRRSSIFVSLFVSSGDGRWIHFRWSLSGGRELRFIDPRKFGRVWYGTPANMAADPYLGSLGVDAKGLLPANFASVFTGRRGMVKPLLLRQDIVAGIGNILADESLWRARIHPRSSVASLGAPALRRLGAGLRQTISAVLSSGGTSMRNFRHPDGRPGRYQERRLVYGKAGQPCPRCRTVLRRIVVGGRGTTICPACQRM